MEGNLFSLYQYKMANQNDADIPTIAKQSGHKSQQTIIEHYIQLQANDVDKYL